MVLTKTDYNLAKTARFQNFPSSILENQELRMPVVFPLLGLLETEVTILTICHLNKRRFTALSKKALFTIAMLYPSADRPQPPLTGATQFPVALHPCPRRRSGGALMQGQRTVHGPGEPGHLHVSSLLVSVELEGCCVKWLLTIYLSIQAMQYNCWCGCWQARRALWFQTC